MKLTLQKYVTQFNELPTQLSSPVTTHLTLHKNNDDDERTNLISFHDEILRSRKKNFFFKFFHKLFLETFQNFQYFSQFPLIFFTNSIL